MVPRALPFAFSYSSLYLILRGSRKSRVNKRVTAVDGTLTVTSWKRTILGGKAPHLSQTQRKIKVLWCLHCYQPFFFQQAVGLSWNHSSYISELTRRTYIASKLPRGFGSQQRHGVQLHFKSSPLCLLPAFSVLHLTNKNTGERDSLPLPLVCQRLGGFLL